jgi:hypothetical protein
MLRTLLNESGAPPKLQIKKIQRPHLRIFGGYLEILGRRLMDTAAFELFSVGMHSRVSFMHACSEVRSQ